MAKIEMSHVTIDDEMRQAVLRPVKLPEPVAVLGLGYVGLSLDVALGRHTSTLGFDIDRGRVEGLRKHVDRRSTSSPRSMAARVHQTPNIRTADLKAALPRERVAPPVAAYWRL